MFGALMSVRAKVAAAALALMGAVLVIALTAGGAIQAPQPGIPDAGQLTAWGLPSLTALRYALAVTTVGLLLVPALLEPSPANVLSRRGFTSTRWATRAAILWALTTVLLTVFSLSDIVAVSPLTAADPARLADFVSNVPQGRALFLEFALVVVAATIASTSVRSTRAFGALVLVLAALVPTSLTGHAAGTSNHELAVASLCLHVLAASVWVGGVIGLVFTYVAPDQRDPDHAVSTLRRFSTIAGVCWALVGISGVVNAAIRVGDWSGLASPYGGLVIAKVAAFAILGGFGWWHRRATIRRALRLPDFVRVAAVELLVMAGTIGIAVGLSRSPTPLLIVPSTDPAFDLLGRPLPPAPTFVHVLFGWTPDGVLLVVLATAAALYGVGIRSLTKRGDHWPLGRTIAWYAGILVAAWSTAGGLGDYGQVMFSLHMVSHMTLSMIAPIGLVLGAPTTLALRTLPGRRIPREASPRQLLQNLLQSRFVRVISHPVVAALIFVGGLYALYFTSLFDSLMESHLGHTAMELHFLAAGCLFFWTLVGVDPAPHKLHPLGRIGLLLLVMPFHAFFAIALMSSDSVLAQPYYAALHRPYATDLLADQRLGAGITWAISELPIVLVMAAVFVQWVRADMREAKRLDRAADRAEAASRNGA